MAINDTAITAPNLPMGWRSKVGVVLLASMIFNGTDDSIVRLNLYPDVFPFRTLDLGFFLGLADDGGPTFGIAIEKLLAFGLS